MQILTVVIGIIFVLLLLSLLATTLMELLSSMFSLRGRNLVRALRNMLASSDPNETLVEQFRANSLYRHLTEQYGGRRKSFSAPSYMNAETFQSILFDVVLQGDGTENFETRLETLPDEDLRNVLRQLYRESGGQMDLFRLEVQNWYNNVMARAGGWYKRYTQKILLFMGLGIAVIFNADTVALYDRLSNDPETLEKLVNAAEQYVDARTQAENLPPYTAPAPTTTPETTPTAPTSTPSAPATAPNSPPSETQVTPAPTDPGSTNTPGPDPGFGQRAPVDPFGNEPAPATYSYSQQPADPDFRTSMEQLKSLLNNEIAEVRRPLGLGWEGVDLRALSLYELITKLLGFILTALAISMGAPFWFDLLKKLVNIRNTGARPYEE